MKSFKLFYSVILASLILTGCGDSKKQKDSKESKDPITISEDKSIPVTKDNYVAAETNLYFEKQAKKSPINTFTHDDVVTQENQYIIRSNRDVVYSSAIVDISEGATFTVPPGNSYQIIQVIDENHYTPMIISPGETKTITPKDVTSGTWIYAFARTQITNDMDASVARQKALKIEAKSARPFVGKDFNEAEIVSLREKMVAEYMAGKVKIIEHKSFVKSPKEADPTSHLYAAAVGWGGLPSYNAQYLPTTNGQGKTTCQSYSIPKPDLDWDKGGFFSFSTYSSEGWIVEDNFYVGSANMQDDGDNFTIFINCPDKKNSVTVQEGWTGVLRFYLPNDEMAFIKYIDSIRGIKVEPVSE
ncbi:DUF1254 domain-containing protein [Xanthomarina sp. F1114]|uniref:DUF1254 domain-containing protein n=1 Tax=Xanthomarina sp. F1114 TaxID=2996019 RepID=UPI00225E5505|nr:DUF1254 domain-containing protein [Xanthomarina sp. F1114]MCX7546327.1 DUF1254 domain-containing protein [Xanthomarina sp. F1114]